MKEALYSYALKVKTLTVSKSYKRCNESAQKSNKFKLIQKKNQKPLNKNLNIPIFTLAQRGDCFALLYT